MGQIERFADLVVRAGVNVQPGQGVVIDTDTAHLEIARAVVEAAYRAGAGSVETVWSDGPMQRSAVDHLSVEQLSRSRPWATIQCFDTSNNGLRMPEEIARETLQAVKPLLESWKKG